MIKDIAILPQWNSRGEKTIKVWIKTADGTYFSLAPTGKSRGRWESSTIEVDKLPKPFAQVKRALIGKEEGDFRGIDALLEGMGGRMMEGIGANLAIAVSEAVIRAASKNNVFKLLNPTARFVPFPMGNVAGGGAHGGGTDIQEFLVIPRGVKDIEEAIMTNFEMWKDVGNALESQGRNDEGAWVSYKTDLKTLDIVCDVANNYNASVGIDMAASQFYIKGKYVYTKMDRNMDPGDQLDFVKDLIKNYGLVYVEDPFHENDIDNFAELTRKVNCIICGDDIYGSQLFRLNEGAEKKASNAILLKPDQAGTVSRVLDIAKVAKANAMQCIVSHRSGETTDSFIADLAVGIEAPLIKCGITGGERVAKLNRLMEIWANIAGWRTPRMAELKI